MTTTSTTTISNAQILALRTEAATVGDSATVRLCDQALSSRASRAGAREKCARIIADAAAMAD